MKEQITMEDKPLAVVLFNDNKPRSMFFGTDYFYEYDVDYSKENDSWYYHLSGMSPNVQYTGEQFWANKDFNGWHFVGCKNLNEENRLSNLSDDFIEIYENLVQSAVIWCSKCRDCFPTDETDNPCLHIWWCEKCGLWSSPGDRCRHRRK